MSEVCELCGGELSVKDGLSRHSSQDACIKELKQIIDNLVEKVFPVDGMAE